MLAKLCHIYACSVSGSAAAGCYQRIRFHQRHAARCGVYRSRGCAAVGDSTAVLAHHTPASGQEALRLLTMGKAIIHFEHASQTMQEASPPEMPDKADLSDLYMQLELAYKMGGQTEKALAIGVERDLFLLG